MKRTRNGQEAAISLKERNQLQTEITGNLAEKLGISELDTLMLIAMPVTAKYPNERAEHKRCSEGST